MGGLNVDISMVLIAFSEMHVFLATLFFHDFFDMFTRNIEFRGFRRVDLAYETSIIETIATRCFFVTHYVL